MRVDGPHRLAEMQISTAVKQEGTASLALIAILALALLIRILAVVFFAGAIGGEGAEYSRIAENLLAGKGYVGIAGEGTQLIFPPLFPLLLAAASLLTGDIKTGGHLITVIAGTLAPLPAYVIAEKMYGQRAALIAAALVAFQPFLIFMSTTVFVEVKFLSVILAAVCFAVLAVDDPRPRNFIASGIFYGLAYLIRPEAVAYIIGATIILILNFLVRRRHDSLSRFTHIKFLLVPFICLAAPYIVWLSMQTGQVRLEGKTPMNMATEIRLQKGETFHSANFKVDADGREQGVWNQPNIVTIKAHSLSLGEFANYFAVRAQTVWLNASNRLLTGNLFGSPLLFALAIIGLFARPWHSALALHQLHLLGILGLVVFGTFFIYYDHPRFYVVALAVFCIWASAGLLRLVRWGRATGQALGLRSGYRAGFGALIGGVAFTLLLAAPTMASKWMFEWSREDQAVKTAGEWLRDNSSKPIRVLNSSTPLSFHAGAEHFWLPYCDEETALRYIERKHISHVVLQSTDIGALPYVEKWMKIGVPYPGAALAYSFEAGFGQTVKIYEIGN